MRIFAIILALVVTMPACTAALPYITKVLQKTQDAAIILQQVDSAVRPFLAAEEDKTRLRKYEDVFGKAQRALQVVVRSARGAEAASSDEELQAMREFTAAYSELERLLNELGLVKGGTMRAQPGAPQLDLEEPLMMSAGGAS